MKQARLLLFAFAFAGSACDLSMHSQPRLDAQSADTLWRGGPARRAPPEHSVVFQSESQDAAAPRPAVTAALIQRGQERYGIYCEMCHSPTGDGQGAVPSRGFPAPISFVDPRQRALEADHIYDVITKGYGVMYGLGDRIAPADRWAITLYVRALQDSSP
jgi:mono/diheme cytochrome c family protein